MCSAPAACLYFTTYQVLKEKLVASPACSAYPFLAGTPTSNHTPSPFSPQPLFHVFFYVFWRILSEYSNIFSMVVGEVVWMYILYACSSHLHVYLVCMFISSACSSCLHINLIWMFISSACSSRQMSCDVHPERCQGFCLDFGALFYDVSTHFSFSFVVPSFNWARFSGYLNLLFFISFFLPFHFLNFFCQEGGETLFLCRGETLVFCLFLWGERRH